MRDEFREDYDDGRGGWGARIREEEMRAEQLRDVYASDAPIPGGSNADYFGQDEGLRVAGKRGRDEQDEEFETSRYSSHKNRRRQDDY